YAAGDQRQLERCKGLRGVAVAQDGQDLSALERGGKGICREGGNDDAILVGRLNLDRSGQLRRQLHLWRRPEGRVPATYIAGRFLPARPVRALSGSRQRVGMDGGLLERQLSRRARGWLGLDGGRLLQSRRARWLLVRRS